MVTGLYLKVLPHIDATTAVRQITTLGTLSTSKWRGAEWQSTTEIRPHAQVPLFRLPVLEHLEGGIIGGQTSRWWAGILVLRDYLKGTKGLEHEGSFRRTVCLRTRGGNESRR